MLFPLNSVQLNIVSVLDVCGALIKGRLEGNLFMIDNSVNANGEHSVGQGTAKLSTNCTQGQVINWIVYPIIGTTAARISNIHFVDRNVCTKLQRYGQPVPAVSPAYLPGLTPVYDYWAGIIRPDVPLGNYHYQIQFELGNTIMNLESPSLNVTSLSCPTS